jgi:hypothetical protein
VQQTNLAMLARVQQVAAVLQGGNLPQGGSQRPGQPSGLGYFFNLGMDKAL